MFELLHNEIVDWEPWAEVIHDYNGVEYRRIPGYYDYYIDEYGDVISLKNGTMHDMATYTNQHGHLYVDLSEDGHRNKCLVHRLVAEVYLENPNNYPIVRHLDDQPWNNGYENLAWGTQKDNRQDMIDNDHDFRKPVYCLEKDKVYRSCAKAAEELGVSRAAITNCCQRKSHSTAGGLHLCYLDDKDDMLNSKQWMKQTGRYKPIIAYNLTTGETRRFNSRKEAAIKLSLNDSGISNVLAKRIKHTHGWTFSEPEEW